MIGLVWLVLVLLEPVRSAEPPIVSGTTPLITSSAISDDLRVATFGLLGGELLLVLGDRRVEACRQLAADAALELGADLRIGGRQALLPLGALARRGRRPPCARRS